MRNPTASIDYTNKDYEAFRQMMLEALKLKMPEYTDLRQSDAGVVILELLAQGLDILSYYQDVFANEAYLTTLEQRENALKWCTMLSYVPRYSTPSVFKQVFVLASPQVTETIVPAGTVVKTVGDSVEPEVVFETASDFVIPPGVLGDELDDDGKYLYTATLVQGISVNGELLGSSSGSANQTFKLGYAPVIISDLTVLINEGSGFERWVRVDNFVDSGTDSLHYIVQVNDNDEVTLLFGNGIFGKIPAVYENGIYADYRVGGGIVGNVGANKITQLDSSIGAIAKTFNPYLPEEYGADKEGLEEIRINAPVAYRTYWGALTLEDFSILVKRNFNEVLFATAIQDSFNIDDLHIYVLLQNNMPVTQGLIDRVLEMFDQTQGGRKIVGANEIFVEPAEVTFLDLNASLIVVSRHSKTKVEAEIRTFITEYFAIGNYDFGTELSFSKLAAQIIDPDNAIEGIRSFKFLSDVDIIVPRVNEIFALNSLSMDVIGGVD